MNFKYRISYFKTRLIVVHSDNNFLPLLAGLKIKS